jgi:hypothetical protein
MEETILTRHPEKKQGVRISKAKYDAIRDVIVGVVRAKKEVTFDELAEAANKKLRGKFDGSITWYVTTVKLDLEARKIIKRTAKASPQRLRLVGN